LESDSEPFSELSTLVRIRFRHQSEEEASSVCVARAGSTQGHDESETSAYPHNSNATTRTSQHSERRQLSKKINEIIKAGSVQTEGTGLNRRNRWTTEKAASGSSFQDAAVSGNVANAQATARRSASNVSSFHPICRVDSGLTIITGFEATGQRVCITQEYRVIGIGQNQPPLFSHQWMFRLCCCR
jgi:hypothetical protein